MSEVEATFVNGKNKNEILKIRQVPRVGELVCINGIIYGRVYEIQWYINQGIQRVNVLCRMSTTG